MTTMTIVVNADNNSTRGKAWDDKLTWQCVCFIVIIWFIINNTFSFLISLLPLMMTRVMRWPQQGQWVNDNGNVYFFYYLFLLSYTRSGLHQFIISMYSFWVCAYSFWSIIFISFILSYFLHFNPFIRSYISYMFNVVYFSQLFWLYRLRVSPFYTVYLSLCFLYCFYYSCNYYRFVNCNAVVPIIPTEIVTTIDTVGRTKGELIGSAIRARPVL